jgi:uncharacterized LabA/DUF88 family protein
MSITPGITIPNPHARRWMMFVDGENLTIEGKKFCQRNDIPLNEGKHYREDVFLWFPNVPATRSTLVSDGHLKVEAHAIRSHYYTSVQGDGEIVGDVKRSLRELGFDPNVFKKPKNSKSKGVDLSIARDMLAHAFRGNYDVAVLIAGDSDYVPLIEEVKRLGKVVYGCFLDQCGINEEMKLSFDKFFPIDDRLRRTWTGHKSCDTR